LSLEEYFGVIKDYRVINREMVDSLARQLGLPVGIEEVVETEATGTVKMLGARRKKQRITKGMEPGDPRLVNMLIESLRDSGNITSCRPESYAEWQRRIRAEGESGNPLIHEFWLEATPVTLPTGGKFEELGGPDALRVWVVDPLESSTQPAGPWDFVGSFVFLVEAMTRSEFPLHLVSGVSALRALVDVTAGHDPNVGPGLLGLAPREELGRGSVAHPVEKLRRVGGIPGSPRLVDAVYKIAYMTNEQSATLGGKEVRVNDILAYPLMVTVL
jgi:hypothetical protein